MKKTATFIRFLDKFTGVAKLYRVSPKMAYEDGGEVKKTSFVVASATVAMFSGPETYLFPSNKDGEIINWGELDGSYRGGLDHELALSNAGYSVKNKEVK